MRFRWRLTVLTLCTLTVAMAAISAYWYWAAAQTRELIADWRRLQESRGYSISYDGPEVAGFPFEVRTAISSPRIESPEGWRWSGPPLAGTTGLGDPFRIDVQFPGLHDLDLTGAGYPLLLQIVAQESHAALLFAPSGKLQRSAADLRQVEVMQQGDETYRIEQVAVVLGAPHAPEGAAEPPVSRLNATLSSLTLPEGRGGPFGERIALISIDSDVLGPLPRSMNREGLARWRDSGGMWKIHRGRFEWGELAADLDGSLTLDQDLYPAGELNAVLAGLPRLLDLLVEDGRLQPKAAETLKLAITMLATERNAAGQPLVRLPITLRDGQLFLGPVPLARLRPVL